jgi:hypothetical protein
VGSDERRRFVAAISFLDFVADAFEAGGFKAAFIRARALTFAARINALTSSSLRIELQPGRPLLFAMSARSFHVWVLREAVVIKGPNLR